MAHERAPWLVWLPIVSTGLFYGLPRSFQGQFLVQMGPQCLAYGAMILWALQNPGFLGRIGLQPVHLARGVTTGMNVGLALGLFNSWIILVGVPWAGGDLTFLADTPHAKVPWFLMIPWFILFIAVMVEVNFRGFLLGRLLVCFRRLPFAGRQHVAPGLAAAVSSLVFSFDPFMVMTFRHLHWIAVWDGLVWAFCWLRFKNLSLTIVAHAAEVVILYTMVRIFLT